MDFKGTVHPEITTPVWFSFFSGAQRRCLILKLFFFPIKQR